MCGGQTGHWKITEDEPAGISGSQWGAKLLSVVSDTLQNPHHDLCNRTEFCGHYQMRGTITHWRAGLPFRGTSADWGNGSVGILWWYINKDLRVVHPWARSTEVMFGFSILKDFQNMTRHSPGQPPPTWSLAVFWAGGKTRWTSEVSVVLTHLNSAEMNLPSTSLFCIRSFVKVQI